MFHGPLHGLRTQGTSRIVVTLDDEHVFHLIPFKRQKSPRCARNNVMQQKAAWGWGDTHGSWKSVKTADFVLPGTLESPSVN